MNENVDSRISADELKHLIEAEQTDKGYEFSIRNDRYLSRISTDVLSEYSKIASDIMEHTAELVETGKVTAQDLQVLNDQIGKAYPEKDEQERILFLVIKARSKGIIDEYLEACIQRQTTLKGLASRLGYTYLNRTSDCHVIYPFCHGCLC